MATAKKTTPTKEDEIVEEATFNTDEALSEPEKIEESQSQDIEESATEPKKVTKKSKTVVTNETKKSIIQQNKEKHLEVMKMINPKRYEYLKRIWSK